MTYKRSFSLQLRVVETIEVEVDDTPSLPPMPVVETTGSTVSEETRPLSKCGNLIPFARTLKRVG